MYSNEIPDHGKHAAFLEIKLAGMLFTVFIVSYQMRTLKFDLSLLSSHCFLLIVVVKKKAVC